MRHTSQHQSPGERPEKANLYQEVTDKIIAELEQGRVPWVQPWGGAKAALGLPRNAATGRRYSGINILILWGAVFEAGFACQHWLTFRQALDLGGNVRKGERGTTVCYADRFIPKGERERAQKDGDEPGTMPFLKRFTVFNIAQCDGLPEHFFADAPVLPECEIIPHARSVDRRNTGGFPHWRRSRLLRAGRRLHSGAAAARLLRADQLLPHLFS